MKALWSRRSFLTVLTILLAIAPVSSALAAPPEFFTYEFHEIVPVAGCDFPVQFELTANFRASVHLDHNDDFKMQIERVSGAQYSFTNLDTGTSVSGPGTGGAGPNIIRLEKDGSLTFTVNGLIENVTVPGQGVVVQGVGRITFDLETFEIVFQAGQHTRFTGESVEDLCAALA